MYERSLRVYARACLNTKLIIYTDVIALYSWAGGWCDGLREIMISACATGTPCMQHTMRRT